MGPAARRPAPQPLSNRGRPAARPAPWHSTDDTATAAVLLRHLVQHGEVRPDAPADGFAEEFTREYNRKYGPSTYRVLREIRRGDDWRAVTARQFCGQGSYGNGAALRVAPLGAWFAENLDAEA